MREIKLGICYLHFKNKVYKTLTVVDVVNKINKNETIFEHKAYNSENQKTFYAVCSDSEGTHIFDPSNKLDITKKYVVYESMYTPIKTYFREIEMFLSKIDKEKYPNVDQEHRFEELGSTQI